MFNPTWFYTGAVYVAAVALARRAGVDVPKRVALFFYALVFVCMYQPLTQDATNLGLDFLRTLPPWAYTTPDNKAINNQINDITLQIVPWAHQVREGWKSFEVPLWNHLSGGGYPLLANPQTGALSPLRILGLPLSLVHAMTFEAATKFLIALTFMFLWCRRRGYSELASTIGAVAFGFSTFIFVWLHFPLITTACFVPAVFYIIDVLAERVTFPRFVCGAAVWTLMLFGGHPETVSHTFFIALLYVSWIVFVERLAHPKFFLTLGAALTIGTLLSAPLLAPFAEAVTKSKRYQDLQAKNGEIDVPFTDADSAKLLLHPQFHGELPYEGWGPAHAESITGFAGLLGIAAWFALLAHGIARRAWRSREMFFVLATVFVLGIILGWPGIADLFHTVFHLAANARLRLFFGLLLAMQTAAAIDLLQRDRRAVAIGIGAASVIIALVYFLSDYAVPEHREAALSAFLPSIGVLAIAVVAVAVKRNEWIVLALLVAVTGELWEAGRDWNPVVTNEWNYPKTPLLRALDEAAAKVPKNEPFRIVGNGPAFFPNLSGIYGYEDIRPHDPMANGRYIGLLSLVTNYDASDYFAEWNEWDKRIIDFLNVRFVVTTKGELGPKYRRLYGGDDGGLWENVDVLPRFYGARNVILEFRDDYFYQRLKELEGWSHTALLDKLDIEDPAQRRDFFDPRPAAAPVAQVTVKEFTPTDYRLHVKAPRWSLIASSVTWWPGWKVERNGRLVEPIRINGGFIGFAVPPGELDVRVYYEPWTFRAGVAIALVTIAGLVAYRVRQRRTV
ncbi:MAG TPA: YfhO family protein [Thermoanaerobaculia bacterium]|nr:YfhO family protein [Thermoanaerobaculia bacterium]